MNLPFLKSEFIFRFTLLPIFIHFSLKAVFILWVMKFLIFELLFNHLSEYQMLKWLGALQNFSKYERSRCYMKFMILLFLGPYHQFFTILAKYITVTRIVNWVFLDKRGRLINGHFLGNLFRFLLLVGITLHKPFP